MDSTTLPKSVWRFGTFELSSETGELKKNGSRLKLQGQPIEVLRTLLEHAGDVVTREQLRQRLWPEGTFVDFEHGLNTAIKKIRDALGDEAETPRFIETIARKGYRFIGTLQVPPETTAVTERGKEKRRRRFLIAAVVAFVAAFAAFVWYAVHLSEFRIKKTTQLTFDGNVLARLGLETDGRRVYYAKRVPNRIYSVPIHGGEESSFAVPVGSVPVILHISPDGSTLLLKPDTGENGSTTAPLWRVPTNGAPAMRLGDVTADTAAYSPDGSSIVFARSNHLYRSDAQGRSVQMLSEAAAPVTWVQYEPDGRHVRFATADTFSQTASTAPQSQVSAMWRIEVREGSQPVRMDFRGVPNPARGVWLEGGRYFLLRGTRDLRSDYWVVPEGKRRWLRSRVIPATGGGPQASAATVSPFEKVVVMSEVETSGQTFLLNPASDRIRPFLVNTSAVVPSFSPDGLWLVFDQVQNDRRIFWRAKADATEFRQLTEAGFLALHANISPDGKRIALIGKWPGHPWTIYLLDADGGTLIPVTNDVVNQADANWMDNEHICFGQPPRYMSTQDQMRAIYIAEIGTAKTEKLPGSDDWFSPVLSKDGKKLLALSIDEHKLGMYDFERKKWSVLLDVGAHRLGSEFWSRDGNWIYVNEISDAGRRLLKVSMAGRIMPDTFHFGETVRGMWVARGTAPDGSILISTFDSKGNIYSIEYE